MMIDCRRWHVLIAGMLVATVAPVALGTIPEVTFVLEARNSAGFGTFEVLRDSMGDYDPVEQTYSWVLDQPIQITENGGRSVIATLESASLNLDADPQINWTFAVRAGSLETEFQLRSARVSFPATIPASVAVGRASSGMTATDADGNGALLLGGLSGAPANTHVYTAAYNGWWDDLPPGTNFAELNTDISVGPGGTGGSFEDFPVSAWEPIGVDVDDMSSQVSFRLSANDTAAGTNNYEIVPEPTTIGLLLVGLGGFVRRQRSR